MATNTNTTITQAVRNKTVAAKSGGSTMKDYVERMQGEINRALPSVMTPERFTRITLSALSTNPELEKTTPKSFLGAMMTAAQLGLEPNTPLGQAYLIPYKNKKNKGVLECQFQLGYKGLIDLAYRSDVTVIQAQTVYANDDFSYEYGLDPKLIHVPAMSDRGEPIAFYAVFKTEKGGHGFEVMSIEDVRAHAKKYSQSYSSPYSPWTKNFEEMAKKTVLKRVLKYAPLKSDFTRGLVADESIKTEISDDMSMVPDDAIDITPEPAEESAVSPVDAETGEIIETIGEDK
ncbi:MAG: recombinase RecT [Bacillota bacterium]|jgi:recombination protein RecT